MTESVLDEEQPDVVAFNGWGFTEARAALGWCRRRDRVSVLMSESQERDAERRWYRELLKRGILTEVDAAFVGGERHAQYLVKLGFSRDRVALGYDVVDNDYFRRGADAARERAADLRATLQLPDRFLLASARFIPKKNLIRLLDAYAMYRRQIGSDAWDLVVLGDGPERAQIEQRRSALGLEPYVWLPGFRQYPDLPAFYGLASAFILPSTTEQWGLVVNEAMASGLPVLVSHACGSAELVREGVSGFLFDPYSVADMAHAMALVTRAGERSAEMGEAARARVALVAPEVFARGLANAIALGQTHHLRHGARRFPNPLLWF
jgi:1,2-diacylglycerol 3-alpha-glucosyltransferase